MSGPVLISASLHEPSSLLGNFYLNALDKHMVRKGFRFFRYVNDMYVLAHSDAELDRLCCNHSAMPFSGSPHSVGKNKDLSWQRHYGFGQ